MDYAKQPWDTLRKDRDVSFVLKITRLMETAVPPSLSPLESE